MQVGEASGHMTCTTTWSSGHMTCTTTWSSGHMTCTTTRSSGHMTCTTSWLLFPTKEYPLATIMIAPLTAVDILRTDGSASAL